MNKQNYFSANILAGILFFFFTASLPVTIFALPVKSAILINLNTGKILYEKKAALQIPPASLTKVMNMYITLDAVKQNKIKLSSILTVTKSAARAGGSSMHLRHGEKLSLNDLLLGMAVVSGNDAACTVAARVSGSEAAHVRAMNQRCKKLGMTRTLFRNVNGLPIKGQLTTARDMLILARSYLKDHPDALRFHRTPAISHRGRVMGNTNNLLGNVPGTDGLKTGFTVASGYNLIFTAKRNGVRLLGVVMGGRTASLRDNAARDLLEAGFRSPNNPKMVSRFLQ